MDGYAIRERHPQDSLDDLTSLLHRAFGALARSGLSCESFEQPIEVTSARIERGVCFVALRENRLVGTMVIEPPDPESACARYRRAEVASLHQFAVDPSQQGLGCGAALLEHAARWSARAGFKELALDTPAAARHLITFYRQHGFRPVMRLQMPGRGYPSVVLARGLDVQPLCRPVPAQLAAGAASAQPGLRRR